MSLSTSDRFQAILIILLAICLLPAAMTTPRVDALHGAGVDSKSDLFISSFSSGATSGLSIRTRNRLTNYFDDLIKAAPLLGQTRVLFARNLYPLFQDCGSVLRRIEGKIIPVRRLLSTPAINLDELVKIQSEILTVDRFLAITPDAICCKGRQPYRSPNKHR
jgi:hypothetical protein